MKRGKKSEVSGQKSVRTSAAADRRPLPADLSPLPIGQRVAVTVPGHAYGADVFLKLADRGVVTAVDPTGDMVTVNFEFRRVPGGLRVPVTHIKMIEHDDTGEHIRE